MHPNIQKLIIFGLVTLFLISWTSFIRQSGLSSFTHHEAEKTEPSRNPIDNSTLGVRLPEPSLSSDEFPLTILDSSKRSLPLPYLVEQTESCHSSTQQMPQISQSPSWMQ